MIGRLIAGSIIAASSVVGTAGVASAVSGSVSPCFNLGPQCVVINGRGVIPHAWWSPPGCYRAIIC